MRHMIAGTKLNRDSGHRKALYRNLVTDLLGYEKITTTEAKAKETRIFTEKIITMGKKGTLDARRRVAAYVYDDWVVEKVMGALAVRYASRHGGYTRMYKLGARLGDNASLVVIELVDSEGKKVVNPNDDAKATKQKAEGKKAETKKQAVKEEARKLADKEEAKKKAAKEEAKKQAAKEEAKKKAVSEDKKKATGKTVEKKEEAKAESSKKLFAKRAKKESE